MVKATRSRSARHLSTDGKKLHRGRAQLMSTLRKAKKLLCGAASSGGFPEAQNLARDAIAATNGAIDALQHGERFTENADEARAASPASSIPIIDDSTDEDDAVAAESATTEHETANEPKGRPSPPIGKLSGDKAGPDDMPPRAPAASADGSAPRIEEVD